MMARMKIVNPVLGTRLFKGYGLNMID